MKYALKATVELETKSKRDNLAQVIKDKIASKSYNMTGWRIGMAVGNAKLLWADKLNPSTIATGSSEEGIPTVNVLLRFNTKEERDEVGLLIEERIIRLPALSGRVEYHKCYHDEIGSNKCCEPEKEI